MISGYSQLTRNSHFLSLHTPHYHTHHTTGIMSCARIQIRYQTFLFAQMRKVHEMDTCQWCFIGIHAGLFKCCTTYNYQRLLDTPQGRLL